MTEVSPLLPLAAALLISASILMHGWLAAGTGLERVYRVSEAVFATALIALLMWMTGYAPL
jgi:hypothetical protein